MRAKETDETPDLGTCCVCANRRLVRTIVMLNGRCPIPGRGWGCLVCNLPADGALAVVCDYCADDYFDGFAALRWFCTGHPGPDGRTEIRELRGIFRHEPHNHPGELFPPEGEDVT